MKTSTKKDFDAVSFMRHERDKISSEIADLNYEQLKKYFERKRSKNRIVPSR